ncbi:hypothetical protein JZ751_027970 [Albula glossodonta]|uniref:TCTP domain-containing protein n=1 Tax=Albula glossodonta TaxID=121402 RepID=A0A8T2PAF7_9TELE|nr:hypothetical protein JZ751_027970 [Albula glossodonta]
MIIYKDIITGDEMFSDIYKVKESESGMLIEVEGKMAEHSNSSSQTICRTEEFDESLIGSNASAEQPDEGTEATTTSGVDIVINHKLQETSFTKDTYKTYIKDYMKAIKQKLEETNPDRVKPFMSGAQKEIKSILANIKNYQFFTGENMNPEGMVGLLDYREDGITPYMIFFKDGLEIEKCVSTTVPKVCLKASTSPSHALLCSVLSKIGKCSYRFMF